MFVVKRNLKLPENVNIINVRLKERYPSDAFLFFYFIDEIACGDLLNLIVRNFVGNKIRVCSCFLIFAMTYEKNARTKEL